MAHLDIDAQTWAVLSRLLDEALDLPETERPTWLDALAPEYAPLKPQLADLLSRSGRVHGLNTLPALAPASAVGAGTAGHPGNCVGPYRLVRLLGEGGMGAVWLAERSDRLISRPVALKLPRRSWQHPALAERFARERTILAALNHPNIARLYDAGLTEDGLPFLALEYVEGRPIDEFCRAAGLPTAARLRMFTQVIEAVAHAHARLIVHRDLKPSNILVTAEGQVRLLDFGIAGLLEGDTAPASELTAMSGRVLTLHYASPEQITGAPLGVASDIYSLGVVLYELLTGERPHTVPPGTPARELEQAILHAEPRRPSEVVHDPRLRPAQRGAPATNRRKARKKYPDERYATAAALAADLGHHLEGRPVLARPDSRAYRLAKFVRRNGLAVGAAAAVALALVAGTAAALWQAHVALAEKARAEEVKEFIAGIFRDADPYGTSGSVPNAVDLLTRARAKIESDLAGRPELQVELLGIVGWSLHNLQDLDGAEAATRALLAEARRSLPPDDPRVLDARILMTQIDRLRGRQTGLRAEVDALIPLLRAQPHAAPVNLVLIYKLRAHLAIDDGRFHEAVAAAQEALTEAERRLPAIHSETAACHMLLALALLYDNQAEAAVPHAEGALRIALALDPANPRHPQVIETHAVLGRALQKTGDHRAAIEHLSRALDDASEIIGATRLMVGFYAQNLAGCELEAGLVRPALEHVERSLAIVQTQVDPVSYTYAAVLGTRGRAWLAAARPEMALPDLQRSAETLAQANGPDHPRTQAAQLDHALVLAQLGRFDEARQLLASITPAGGTSLLAARRHHVAGTVDRLAGEPASGSREQQLALDLVDTSPDGRRLRLEILRELGLASLDAADPAQALVHLSAAQGLSETLHLDTSPGRAAILVGLGRALLALDRADECVAPLTAADEFWRRFDPQHPDAQAAARWLAMARDTAARS